MKKFWDRLRRGNEGLSLVELICAIALLSIVFVSVMGVMVWSSKSYAQSSSEVQVQQEAQTTANLLSNLIVDAQSVEWDEANGTLTILTADGRTITVIYNADALELLYRETDLTGNIQEGVLAQHVTKFKVTNTFEENRNVAFDMTLESSDSKREFSTSFDMTSRNGATSEKNYEGAMILVNTEWILEPNQDLTFDYRVIVNGEIEDGIVADNGTSESGKSTYIIDKNTKKISIHVGAEETDDRFYIKLKTSATTDNGIPYDQKLILVKIRRVKDIKMTGPAHPIGMKGDIYTVTADLSGTNVSNGAREYGLPCDNDYVSPYELKWSYEVKNPDGQTVTASSLGITAEVGSESGNKFPYVFTLGQDLESGVTIKVTAHAVHPDGKDGETNTNKTGLPYGVVEKSYTITITRNGVIQILSGLNRGSEVIFSSDLERATLVYKYGNDATVRYFYRIGQVNRSNGDVSWSEYRVTEEAGQSMKLSNSMSLRFLPEYEYKLEIIGVVYNEWTKKIYWPNYEGILDGSGRGINGFAGFQYDTSKWTDPNESRGRVDVFSCGNIFGVEAVRAHFKASSDFNLSAGAVTNVDNIPTFTITNSSQREFSFELQNPVVGLDWNSFQNNYGYIIQMKVGSNWATLMEDKDGWYVGPKTGNNLFRVISSGNGGRYALSFDNILPEINGQYRIMIHLKNGTQFSKISSSLFDTNYQRFSPDANSLHMYDEGTSAGIVYFNLNMVK